MSAWDEEAHPWLEGEKRLIEAVIDAGRPVLGICLGAQLLADVLGARIYRGSHREIGWFEVRATRDAAADPVGGCLPDAFETFLWHGDSFDLPDGAVHLAGSAAFAHQAFRWRRVLALQFHLEVRPDWVQRIAGRDAAQLLPMQHVQPVEQILARPESLYRANNAVMDRVLDAWLEQAPGAEC
jgi:GMP synthase-like glutamine amidotransferase